MDDIEYLKSKRVERNLTQRELAAALHVSFQTVANWEAGRTRMLYMVRLLDWSLLEQPAKPAPPRFIRKPGRMFRRNNLGIVPRDRRHGADWRK